MKQVTLKQLIGKAKKFNEIAVEFNCGERLELMLEVNTDDIYVGSLKELKNKLIDLGWDDFYESILNKELYSIGNNQYERVLTDGYYEIHVIVSLWIESPFDYEYHHS